MEYLSVGDSLKNLRLENGYTQTYVAKAIKTTAGLISMYEGNKRLPSRNALIKLAEFYNVSLDRIMFCEETPITNVSEDADTEYKVVEPVPVYNTIEQLCSDDPERYASYNDLMTDYTKNCYFYIKFEKGGIDYWALVDRSKKIKPNSIYLVRSGRKPILVKTEDLTDHNRLNLLGTAKSLTIVL